MGQWAVRSGAQKLAVKEQYSKVWGCQGLEHNTMGQWAVRSGAQKLAVKEQYSKVWGWNITLWGNGR